MKENVKKFWEKNRGEIVRVAYWSAGLALGCYLGHLLTVSKFEQGLSICFVKNPELKTMLVETVEAIKEQSKI